MHRIRKGVYYNNYAIVFSFIIIIIIIIIIIVVVYVCVEVK